MKLTEHQFGFIWHRDELRRLAQLEAVAFNRLERGDIGALRELEALDAQRQVLLGVN